MEQHDPNAVEQAERSTWNRCAATYMESAAPLTKHAVSVLVQAARLSRGCRALDVACGPGHIARMMADTGATVTGIDLAPKMVSLASGLYLNIEFKEANVDNLPFDSNTFDAVLVNYAIHHFARPGSAVKEIHRVLKRKGRFVFAGPLEHFGFWAFIAGLTAHYTMDELAHGSIYLEATREDYEKLVVDAGFREYSVTEQVITLHQDNLDAVLKTGWEMCELGKLPRETQDKIRITTMENASQYKTERSYEFPDRIVVGVATK